jgi:hypothetical protein
MANNKIYSYGTKPYKLHTIFVSEFMAFVLNEMRKATQIDDKQYKKAAAKASTIYSGSLAFIPGIFPISQAPLRDNNFLFALRPILNALNMRRGARNKHKNSITYHIDKNNLHQFSRRHCRWENFLPGISELQNSILSPNQNT